MKEALTGKKQFAKKGSSILEILIAVAVLTLGISAVIMLVFANQSLTVDIETGNEALSKAETMLENARAASRQDFNLVNPIPTAPDGIYNRGLDVQAVDLFTKKVVSNISWNLGGGRPQNIQLTTLVTNLAGPNGENTCSSVLTGDWAHPELLGDVDVGQSNGASDVDIFLNKAYVTTDPSVASQKDFHIIDVSNPNVSPLPILSSINTGPGLRAVQVGGQYAYAANRSINGQLQIIDIAANPPQLKSTFKIVAVTGSGGQALGNTIFYKDGYVYLGLTKTQSGPEFNVIDVSAPLNPIWKGGYSIGHDVNAILVRNNLAYVATPANAELKILDISVPVNPTLFGEIDLPDNSANGKSMAIVGNKLYLGRTEGSSPLTKELQVLDITNPASPTPGASADVGSTINAVTIRDNLAFMITNDANLEFQIWDLNTMALYGSKNIQPTSAGGMDCEGNYVYIAQRSSKALQIVGPGL